MSGFIVLIGNKNFAEVDISEQCQSIISFHYWEGHQFSFHIETNDGKYKKIWKSCHFDRIDDVSVLKSDSLNLVEPIATTPLGEFSSLEDFDNSMDGMARMSNDTDCDSSKYSHYLPKLKSITVSFDEEQIVKLMVPEYRYISIVVKNFSLNLPNLEIQTLGTKDHLGMETEYVPLQSKLDMLYSGDFENKEFLIHFD